MSLTGLHSARLRAGHWQDLTAAELEALFAPDVVRWLPGGFHGLDNDGARRVFLKALEQQAEVAALWSRGQGAGLVILSRAAPGENVRNLGYLLAEAYWGQGLASELIAALQAHFGGSGITLSGGVMAENAASARVLEKAGFRGQAAAGEAAGETVYVWHAGGDA